MGFFSRIWKGIKNVVKSAAKRIKKVAKKVVESIPGGKKLWKEAGRLGKSVVKGIGKITSALGPIGMIGLSILAPYAAPLWASFGAAAGASTSILGSIGTAIYNGANWVGSTFSAMTSGISKGISTVIDGGFKGLTQGSLSKASEQAFNGFADAFTGRAGAEGIRRGRDAAIESAFSQAAGNSITKQTTDKIMGDIGFNSNTQASLDNINASMNQFQPGKLNLDFQPSHSPVASSIDQLIAEGGTTASARQTALSAANVSGALNQSANVLTAPVATTSLLSKAAKLGEALLSGGGSMEEPLVPQFQPLVGIGAGIQSGLSSATGGQGSSGGSFLSKSMLSAMQQQQERMARGFS